MSLWKGCEGELPRLRATTPFDLSHLRRRRAKSPREYGSEWSRLSAGQPQVETNSITVVPCAKLRAGIKFARCRAVKGRALQPAMRH